MTLAELLNKAHSDKKNVLVLLGDNQTPEAINSLACAVGTLIDAMRVASGHMANIGEALLVVSDEMSVRGGIQKLHDDAPNETDTDEWWDYWVKIFPESSPSVTDVPGFVRNDFIEYCADKMVSDDDMPDAWVRYCEDKENEVKAKEGF